MPSSRFMFVAICLMTILCAGVLAAPPAGAGGASFPSAMLAARARAQASHKPPLSADIDIAWRELQAAFPIETDWLLQDTAMQPQTWFAEPATGTQIERDIIRRALDEIKSAGNAMSSQLDGLTKSAAPSTDARWLTLYVQACQARRELRLKPLIAKWPRIIFTKHHNMGGSHYAYTEAQSDAQAERTFHPGTALCLLEFKGGKIAIRNLVEDAKGVIRDPDVSYDGQRILFAWKKSDREDDYHLYEMEVASGKIRQITSGLGYADYEGQYLPSGDIIFNSTRCVQTTDCFTTEVSNLHTCDKDGKLLRRLGFDQVSTNFPTVLNDGRIVYTRWEYSDRGQVFVQGLMQMNPDGTGQTEFYGMNSWFPTTILHARAVANSHKLVAVASGHHTRQAGKLIVIDNTLGQEENSGVQLVAPIQKTEAVHVDRYGQDGDLFQYPYPLSETQYLVTYTPYGWSGRNASFGVYFMDIDGRRELLALDPVTSCNQSIPLAPRATPGVRPNSVDYHKNTAFYYMQDVYAGQGLPGIPRGTIKKLRVIALDWRLALIGSNNNGGPAGGAMVATPIAIGNGAWDVKMVLGDATVNEDGSAFFEVPARTPIYFQAIDDKGHMVQSMRSWSTLQPGETSSCVGCHEEKYCTPLSQKSTYAISKGPQKLQPFYGPARGFSFPKEIQPILNRNCVSCHDNRDAAPPGSRDRAANAGAVASGVHPFSLLGTENVDKHAKRQWSDAYLALTHATVDPTGKRAATGDPNNPLVTWIHAQSAPPVQPPYFTGAAKSKLIEMLEKGHGKTHLTREELDKISCWIDLAVPYCGDYVESNAWSPADMERHQRLLKKRQSQQELERKAIEDYIRERQNPLVSN